MRNTGSRASRDLAVWVEGLDAHGTVVARAQAFPTPQVVPPGHTATFVVALPNDAAIRSFHVEAVGR